MHGTAKSGQLQFVSTSPAPGSRSSPVARTSSTTSGGSSPSSSAATRPICADTTSSTASHSAAENARIRTVTWYGVTRLPCTIASTSPGLTVSSSTLPRRA
ncbi:hypothetical protein JOF29_002457 [Kribbella aluminosa]|uniref:Uncharacterized protein n=1 Tax=Kribbella aluminosa TaxID=416017 RepID=A0ABS4UID5_9ACTN|nr:hypothetical protein [Kribbella aluminosa]